MGFLSDNCELCRMETLADLGNFQCGDKDLDESLCFWFNILCFVDSWDSLAFVFYSSDSTCHVPCFLPPTRLSNPFC